MNPRLLVKFFLFLNLAIFSLGAFSGKLCEGDILDLITKKQTLTFLEIQNKNPRKWVKNYMKAYADGNTIKKKYKKRFKADLVFHFASGIKCNLPAKIRISGDFKDHILNGPPPITSLDVTLKKGNFNSIVDFKLFLPATREGKNEIFMTRLLSSLGFLSPRTQFVKTKFDGIEFTFLFQEKIVKEFLEHNFLREAPVLEGDERFIFSHEHEDYFDEFSVSKLQNKKWALKGQTSEKISIDAVNMLNSGYLNHLSARYLGNYNSEKLLDTKFISFSENFENYNNSFSAILSAAGGWHGLRPHNRKFYFDPFYNQFKSIYYDGGPDLYKLSYDFNKYIKKEEHANINKSEIKGASIALGLLNSLNIENFHTDLINDGADFSFIEVKELISKIRNHLDVIKSFHKKDIELKTRPNYFSKIKVSKNYLVSKRLAFVTNKSDIYEICTLDLKTCSDKKLIPKQVAKLLSSELQIDGFDVIFIGDKRSYLGYPSSKSFKRVNFNEIKLENDAILRVYGSPIPVIDISNKSIYLKQDNQKDRFLIYGGQLSDWSINFVGLKNIEPTKGQRFDENLITGCLTFLDTKISQVSIKAYDGNCEDSINLVRVNGDIEKLLVESSYGDAIDSDFSDLVFNEITISGAINDCIDFSSGKYLINRARLDRCSDKAISIGEGSEFEIKSSDILNSNIGIAAKDSSTVNADNVIVDSVDTCFKAYNKKQEYWGGSIFVNNHNCLSNQIDIDESSFFGNRNEL